MAGLLGYLGIRVFDHTQWAEPLREELRANAERLAREAGLTIELIRRHTAIRKEERIQGILATRGDQPGLVQIFAAMESCASYRPWFDKAKGQALLKLTADKCLHDYFYFIDEDFGLGYVLHLSCEVMGRIIGVGLALRAVEQVGRLGHAGDVGRGADHRVDQSGVGVDVGATWRSATGGPFWPGASWGRGRGPCSWSRRGRR